MAGTINLSLSQQLDIYGQPLAGGQLYLIQAGTVSTPQNGYQDAALTIPLPNPITLDAAGRIPQFFLADGTIKVRLQDKTGVVQLAADSILVIGPSAGGGGGGAVDPTTIYQTGDMKPRYGTGAHTGWARCNNLTIGSATSGATERANADCQALFLYLWVTDVNLVVSGGRGASAAADWSANKSIALPDWRGRLLGFLDDMGNTSAARLNTLASTTLGAAGGEQTHTLTAAEIAPHTHSGTTGGMNANNPHSHTSNMPAAGGVIVQSGPGTGVTSTAGGTINPTNIEHGHNFTTDTGAGVTGSGHNTVPPTMLATMYIKL